MMYEKITGVMIYYYFVCRRKLWLFHNDIAMEDENELVQIGKYIDCFSFPPLSYIMHKSKYAHFLHMLLFKHSGI